MIKVLHTADWHIDAPLREFTDWQRRELRSSLLEMPGRIADLCIREGCDMMLLSGDVFDGPYTREGYEAVYRALERVQIPVFISPGNHDPYRDGSVWTREAWPENVYLFRRQEITSFTVRELECRIYGAAFTGMDCPALLTDFHADCTERYALLVVHGDPTNPASPYNPITAAQIREAGVDYAALGHIHAQGRFEAGAGVCAWPGCAMGKGYDETGTKGVLIAELEESVYTRFIPLDVPRFFEYNLEVSGDPVETVASLLPPGGSRDHYRVRLTGEARPGFLDYLPAEFREYPNLTILDETVPLGDIWEGAGEDNLAGLFLRILQEGTRDADPETVEKLELAARLGRKILEGREVELP